jgi:hypothetical protein
MKKLKEGILTQLLAMSRVLYQQEITEKLSFTVYVENILFGVSFPLMLSVLVVLVRTSKRLRLHVDATRQLLESIPVEHVSHLEAIKKYLRKGKIPKVRRYAPSASSLSSTRATFLDRLKLLWKSKGQEDNQSDDDELEDEEEQEDLYLSKKKQKESEEEREEREIRSRFMIESKDNTIPDTELPSHETTPKFEKSGSLESAARSAYQSNPMMQRRSSVSFKPIETKPVKGRSVMTRPSESDA